MGGTEAPTSQIRFFFDDFFRKILNRYQPKKRGGALEQPPPFIYATNITYNKRKLYFFQRILKSSRAKPELNFKSGHMKESVTGLFAHEQFAQIGPWKVRLG